jgi:hypothetical protein
MKKFGGNFFIIGLVMLLNSCVTSMTPLEVNSTLPDLTRSTFISQIKLDEGLSSNKCKILVKARNYVAPMGLTTRHDLMNAAKGIDEWVSIDGGNAYFLRSFKWVTVDISGPTQLHVEFDTMICK